MTTNHITERGYTGTLVFYKWLKHNIYGVTDGTVEQFQKGLASDGEYVLLGACEVDVTFDVDTREAEIVGLEKQREKIQAELGRQIAVVEERISKLRALPHTEEWK
jgi:hypothetical protein